MNNVDRLGGFSGDPSVNNQTAPSSKCMKLTNLFKAAAFGILLFTGGTILTSRRDSETAYDPDACLRPGCLTRNMKYVEFHPTNPLLPVRNVFEQAIYNEEQQICDKYDAWQHPLQYVMPPLPRPQGFQQYLNSLYSCKANHSLTVEASDTNDLKQNQLIDKVLKPLKKTVDYSDPREQYRLLEKTYFEKLKSGDHRFKS